MVNGATPKSSNQEYWDGTIPWATPDDLGDVGNDTLFETDRFITEDGLNSCGTTLVPTGSIILSTRAPIGHLAIAGCQMCTNQGCRSLVFKLPDDKKYFYYQLIAEKEELQSRGEGTTFKELALPKLKDVWLYHPPYQEQQIIARFLDHKTALIDQYIANKKKQIKLLEKLRTAIISEAVTQGLNPDVEMKDSGVEWCSTIPAHWKLERFRYFLDGGTQNGLYKAASFSNVSGVPMISMGEAFSGRVIERLGVESFTLTGKEKEDYGLEAGDLLFARRSLVFEGSGKCSMVGRGAKGSVFESSIIRVRVKDKRTLAKFALCFMGSVAGRFQMLQNTKQVTISGIDSFAIKDFVYIDLPINEQEAIVRHIEKQGLKIDSSIEKVNEQIVAIERLRASLISEAVTGKIDVRDFKPEPMEAITAEAG